MDDKLNLTGLQADIILKGTEAVLYLNYIQQSGYDSLVTLRRSYQQEVVDVKDKLLLSNKEVEEWKERYTRFSEDYSKQVSMNEDIKKYLHDISDAANINTYSYKRMDYHKIYSSLDEFLSDMRRAIADYSRYSNRNGFDFDGFLVARDTEIEKEVNKRLKAVDWKIAVAYDLKLREEIKKHKNTFWRRAIGKLLKRK